MPLSDQNSHSSPDEHNSKSKVYCEDCGKNISGETRHFQSESQILRSQRRNQINKNS